MFFTLLVRQCDNNLKRKNKKTHSTSGDHDVDVLADAGERRVGAVGPEIGTGEPDQGPLEPGELERRADRPARGPRVRVHGETATHHHRQELEQGRGGRQHGTLELHLEATLGDILRSSIFLHDLQRQEWSIRRRGVPEEGSTGFSATKNVNYYYFLFSLILERERECVISNVS